MKRLLLLLFFPLMVLAEPVTKSAVYMGIGGGVSILNGMDINQNYYNYTVPNSPVTRQSISQTFSLGGQANIAIGYRFLYDYRTEFEVAYLTNSRSSDRVLPNGSNLLSSGHSDSTAFMINAYYDFTSFSKLTPYLGGGLGCLINNSPYTDGQTDYSQVTNATYFAYQGIAGFNYAFNQTVSGFIDYRRLGTGPKTVQYRSGDIQYDNAGQQVIANLVTLGVIFEF
ncbi:MAG: outer membrane beta-barrel protein [Gammaproteobacteria bacterium]|nr:outer membrane beta-barrel protein [Gammaproteobacteria bacterium]